MKKIAVISGKGGTGKTSLLASFVSLVPHSVAVDADVDAANLSILMSGEDGPSRSFLGNRKAEVDAGFCSGCLDCAPACPVVAIHEREGLALVDTVACEGCGVCALVCPLDAITLFDHTAGSWTVRSTDHGPLVHAALGIAEDNSGKLVDILRREASRIAVETNADWLLIDGPPGIGCPVHAAIGRVDLLAVVTEPSSSGVHDLERVMDLADHFQLPAAVVINKADLNPEMTVMVEEAARRRNVPVAGRIPFSLEVPRALAKGQGLLEVEDTRDTVIEIWKNLGAILDARVENESDTSDSTSSAHP